MALPSSQSVPAPRLRVKRGETLALECALEGDLTGWTVRSQIRTPNDRLLAECDVSPLVYDAAEDMTRYTLTVSETLTATWAVGGAEGDIMYIDPEGIVQLTETFAIPIERAVTRVGAA